MNAAQRLHELGQSLWLDNLSREMLDKGTLGRYIREASGDADGWVSLEVSPLLADDSAATIEQAKALHARAACPNLFIKIPGNRAGIPAIDESIAAGVPINVTLLFSTEQCLAAADAYLRGSERRIAVGLKPVRSVASLFVSRWDKAIANAIPQGLRNRLGIAFARQTYRAWREFHARPAWRRLADAGVPAQRLLWASTGTKDPTASDVLYIEALAASDTIVTMPDETLLAFADHGAVSTVLGDDDGDFAAVIGEFVRTGLDRAALSERLLQEGAQSFAKSWYALIECIAAMRAGTTAAHAA